MKTLSFWLVIIFFTYNFIGLKAQIATDTVNYSALKTKIKASADSMSLCFLNNEFEKYIHFHYPGFIHIIGGEKNMLETLQKNYQRGMKAVSIENYIPERIFVKDSIYQCTFTQKSILQMGSKKLEITSCILGLSFDKGQNWLFFNTAGLSRERIKEIFPELSNELIIGEQKSIKLN